MYYVLISVLHYSAVSCFSQWSRAYIKLVQNIYPLGPKREIQENRGRRRCHERYYSGRVRKVCCSEGSLRQWPLVLVAKVERCEMKRTTLLPSVTRVCERTFLFGRLPGFTNLFFWYEQYVDEYGTLVEWYWQGKTEVLGAKPVPVPLFRPPISWTDLGSNLRLRGERPVTNRLRYDVTFEGVIESFCM
jgi:hypothetical protein